MFYLVRVDTVTHYLRLGPEASAQCQMGVRGKKGLGQATGSTRITCVRAGRALWSAWDNGCSIMWSRNEAANWGRNAGEGGGEPVLCQEQIVVEK